MAAVVTCAVALPVRAGGDRAACFDAYELAQQLRNAGQLKAARDTLIVCAQSSCPALTRPDCVAWLREVDHAIPSIVLRARDADGRDLADVRVAIDGLPVVDRLDGREVTLDPGEHRLRFERDGNRPVDQTLVAILGEKNRIVSVTFGPPRPPVGPVRSPEQPSSPGRTPLPTGALALGAFGAAAIGVSAYFEITGLRDRDALFDRCAPNCTQAQVDKAYRELLVGDIAAGLGLASLGAAALLVVYRPSAQNGPRSGVSVALQPTAAGAGAVMSGFF